MTLSFRSRLALRWVVASGVLLAASNVAIYLGIRSFLEADLDAHIRTLAETELASAVDDGRGAHLHEIDAPDNAVPPEKFVQLIDPQGRVILQSPNLGDSRPLLLPSILGDALAGRARVVRVDVSGRPGRMIALRTTGPDVYIVAVGLYTDRLQRTLEWTWWLQVSVLLATLLLTGAVGYAVASRSLAPIRRITAQAEAIAHAGLETRLDTPRVDDEIGRMTRLLNEMLDRLYGAIEANRRFAADASHELRGPLTGLLGEVDLALKRGRPVGEYVDVLTGVRARLREMADLTDNLMLLVRAQERRKGVVTEVALAPLVERVADAATAAVAKNVVVDRDVAPELVVYGDERLLERVLDNVIRNALQYSDPGGRVAVAARLQPRTGDWVADEILVTVRDHGPGIPPDERERVFQRFYRIDPSRSRRTGGAGLGLAISREIVQLFGGTIRIVAPDADGAGTTVEIRLPGACHTPE